MLVVATGAGGAPKALPDPNALCPNAPPVVVAGLAPNALCPNAPPVEGTVVAGTAGCPKAEVEPNAELGAVDAAAKGDATAGGAPYALVVVVTGAGVAPNALPDDGFAPKALVPNPPPDGEAPNAEPDPNADAGFAGCPKAL